MNVNQKVGFFLSNKFICKMEMNALSAYFHFMLHFD